MITHARQRWMLHAGEQSSFTLELLARGFFRRERLLESHGYVESLIQGFVNRTHAAATELTNDAIAILQQCVRG
jgi:hypothetical protein